MGTFVGKSSQLLSIRINYPCIWPTTTHVCVSKACLTHFFNVNRQNVLANESNGKREKNKKHKCFLHPTWKLFGCTTPQASKF